MWTQITYVPFIKVTGIEGTRFTVNLRDIKYIEGNKERTVICLNDKINTKIKVKEDYDTINSLLSGEG